MARYLGPTQLGVYGYCAALISLFTFFPLLGLDAVLKRELLERPYASAELIASAVLLRLIAGVIAYVSVIFAALNGWGLHADEPRLIAILGLLLFQPALFSIDLWLQAHLHAPWSVSSQLIALLVGSVARVALIVSGASIHQFALVAVIEVVFGAAGVWLCAKRLGMTFSWVAARMSTMRELCREAWPMMFASLAVIVYMKIDEVMIRQLAGPAAAGIYGAAARLSEVWYFLPMILASSVLPALLKLRGADPAHYELRLQQYYDLSAGAAYALSVPIALAAPWLIRVAYGEAFSAAAPILAVHIWASVFVFIGVARGQWLVNERLQGFYLATTVAGAAANILLNFVAIPRWGALGAAYATVVSYALAAWIGSFFHRSVRPTARMQTRALLIPVLGWRYFIRP